MAEYALMKEAYIQDYKNNYQININEKEANVYEFVATIVPCQYFVDTTDYAVGATSHLFSSLLRIKNIDWDLGDV